MKTENRIGFEVSPRARSNESWTGSARTQPAYQPAPVFLPVRIPRNARCLPAVIWLLLLSIAAGAQRNLNRERFVTIAADSTPLVCSANGQVCAAREALGNLWITEQATHRPLRMIPSVAVPGGSPPVALSPDGSLVISQTNFGFSAFAVWDVQTGAIAFQRTIGFEQYGNGDQAAAFAFSGDGKRLAMLTANGNAEVWDTQSWNIVDSISGFLPGGGELDFGNPRQLIVTAPGNPGRGWTIGSNTISPAQGRPPVPPTPPAPVVVTNSNIDSFTGEFEFAGNGRLLLTGTPGRVIDLEHGTVAVLPSPFDGTPQAQYSATNLTQDIDVSSPDAIVMSLVSFGTYLADPNTLRQLPGRKWPESQSAALSRDGKVLAMVTRNKLTVVHLPDSSESTFQLDGNFDKVRLSDDGKIAILSGDYTNSSTLRSVDTTTGHLLPYPVRSTEGAVSSAGRYGIENCYSATGECVRVFDLAHGRGLFTLPGRSYGAVFSTSGELLAISRSNQSIDVYDLDARKRIASLPGIGGQSLQRVRFSPDGKRLAASGGGFIRIWDLFPARELFTLSLFHLDWAVTTPAGYYDGTDGELKYYYWVNGVRTENLGSALTNHRIPGLLVKAWSEELIKRTDDAGSVLSRPPLSSPVILSAEVDPHSPENVLYSVRVEGESAGGITVRANRNGAAIAVQSRPVDGTFTALVHLAPGTNRVAFWAVDASGMQSGESMDERTLKRTAAPKPELVPAIPQDKFWRVAFSRNGRLMASSSGHSIALWDMRSQRQLRTILEHSDDVVGLSFGATEDVLVSRSKDRTLRVWDTRTGVEVCQAGLYTQSWQTPGIAVSPDGSRIAVQDDDVQLVRIFNVETCGEEAIFDSAGWATPVWLSNSQILARGDQLRKDKLFSIDVDSGKTTVLEAGGEVDRFAAAPHGHIVALLHDGTLKLSNENGVFSSFQIPVNAGPIHDVLALPSGRLLLAGQKHVVLLQPDLTSVFLTFKDGSGIDIAASADERWFSIVSNDQSLALFTESGGKVAPVPFSMPESYGAVTGLRFTADGGVLVASRADGQVLFWDISSSTVFRSIGPVMNTVNQPIPLLVNGDVSRVGMISGEQTAAGAVMELQSVPLEFSTERNQAGQLTMKSLDLKSDGLLKQPLPAPSSNLLTPFQGWAFSASFNAVAVNGSKPGGVMIADVATGKKLSEFRAHSTVLAAAALSADGRMVLTFGDGAHDNSLRLWKQEGTPVWRKEGFSEAPQMAFSMNGERVAAAVAGLVQVFEVSSGNLVKNLTMEPAPATALSFSPDGRRIAVGTRDGLIHLFDCGTGSLLVTLVGDASGSLAFLPSGEYTGSLARSAALSFRVGGSVYPLRQFDLQFNRPDLLMTALAPEMQPVIQAYRAARTKRLEEAHVTEASLQAGLEVPEIAIQSSAEIPKNETAIVPFQAHGTAGIALEAIEVRVNGVLDSRIPARRSQALQGAATVRLASGRNNIELTAIDERGHRSLTETVLEDYTPDKVHRTLYLAAIGLSRYQAQSMNLTFAAKDAGDLTSYFRQRTSELGPNAAFDEIIALEPITDSAATRDGILKLKEALSHATVDDTVIVFFAGHGILDSRLNFFFAPFDMNFAEPSQKGISIAEMEEILSTSHSRQRLLMIDACHSGELDSANIKTKSKSDVPAPKGARGFELEANPAEANAFDLVRSLFMDVRENTGTNIISASRGTEAAYESGTVANGYFTRAVLDGLHDRKADADQDGRVSISELAAWVADEVQQLSHGRQTPNLRQENFEQDFAIE